MAIKLRKGALVKAKNIVCGESIIVKVIDSKYSDDAIEVEIMEGNHKGTLTIVSKEYLVIPSEPAYKIAEEKKNKSEILKELKGIIKSLDEVELVVTNYHYEDLGSYFNDIEVQIWDVDGYYYSIAYKSYEIENFDTKDWWDVVNYMDLKSFKDKEEIFNYIEKEFRNYDDVVVLMKEGCWV